jgi:TIR domain
MQPSIFVSYAHEDASLAQTLATALESQGARVWIDQGELLVGDSLIERISEAIAEFDFVAALVSHASVGSNWCRKEIALAMSKQLKREARRVTVLPIRVGDVAMPPSLMDVKWMPLDPDHISTCAAQIVEDATRHLARPRATNPDSSSTSPGAVTHRRSDQAAHPPDDEPVKIMGVDTAGVGNPGMEQSRGSALYRLPLRLNRIPHPFWTSRFVDTWNHPPAYTTMHRPGIASVQGDRIVLDGTTIEELERYHLTTLKIVVKLLNEQTAEHLHVEQARRGAEARVQDERLRLIQEANKRLDFDA